MDVGAADAARADLDVNVTVLELLGFELGDTGQMDRPSRLLDPAHILLLELIPLLMGIDLRER